MGKHHRAANQRHKKSPQRALLVYVVDGQTAGQADSRTAGPAKQTKTGSVANTNMRGSAQEGFDLGTAFGYVLAFGLGHWALAATCM